MGLGRDRKETAHDKRKMQSYWSGVAEYNAS